jgi:FMN-dependent NADH-azoreductase
MQVLHLDSSILGDASTSRALSAAIVADLIRRVPSAVVIRQDLVGEPIPHLDAAIAAGFRDLAAQGNDAFTVAERARSERLVSEFLASDVVVVGSPMYNFSVSSQLKAWIDRIVQPGRTFRYTPTGPVGLAGNKRVVVASTRGGLYTAGPMAALDFQEAYLKATFGFMGITDVQFVRAESLSKGPEMRAQSMEAALAGVGEVVLRAVAA